MTVLASDFYDLEALLDRRRTGRGFSASGHSWTRRVQPIVNEYWTRG